MKNKLSKIRGIITPTDWADDASIKAVCIATNDEQEYFVENSEKGKDFLKMTEKVVDVVGIISKDNKGQQQIRVKNYIFV